MERITDKHKNIGELSEFLLLFYCLVLPNIRIDSEQKKIKAIEILDTVIMPQKDGYVGDITCWSDSLINQALDTLRHYGISDIKSSSNKFDFKIILDDGEKLNVSLKSFLGDNPSIVNVSHQTSIRYRLINPQIPVDKINEGLDAILGVAPKLEWLKSITSDIVYADYFSENYKDSISAISLDAPASLASYLFDFYIGRKQPSTYQEWFANYLLKSMTCISPTHGVFDSSDSTAFAFLSKKRGVNKVLFTRAKNDHFKKLLVSSCKFDRPSWTRHKSCMLGSVDANGCFLLPINIRLRRGILGIESNE